MPASAALDLVQMRRSRMRQDRVKKHMKQAAMASDSPYARALFSRVVETPFDIVDSAVMHSPSPHRQNRAASAAGPSGLPPRPSSVQPHQAPKEQHSTQADGAFPVISSSDSAYWFEPAPVLRSQGSLALATERPESAAAAPVDARTRATTVVTVYREKLLRFSSRPTSAADEGQRQADVWNTLSSPRSRHGDTPGSSRREPSSTSDVLPPELRPTTPAIVPAAGSRPPTAGSPLPIEGHQAQADRPPTAPSPGATVGTGRRRASAASVANSRSSAASRATERPASAMTIFSAEAEPREGDVASVRDDTLLEAQAAAATRGRDGALSPREVRSLAATDRGLNFYMARARGQHPKRPATTTNADRVHSVYSPAPNDATRALADRPELGTSAAAREELEVRRRQSRTPTASTQVARECNHVLKIQLVRRRVAEEQASSPKALVDTPVEKRLPASGNRDVARSRHGVVRARYNHF